jgi:hypothetical protein
MVTQKTSRCRNRSQVELCLSKILAIAARATGHDEPFDKAARKARDRGADVSLLRSQ